jgi:hypothetical protein
MDIAFPLDLSCGFYPIFFIREPEKQAAHIAREFNSQRSRAYLKKCLLSPPHQGDTLS